MPLEVDLFTNEDIVMSTFKGIVAGQSVQQRLYAE